MGTENTRTDPENTIFAQYNRKNEIALRGAWYYFAVLYGDKAFVLLPGARERYTVVGLEPTLCLKRLSSNLQPAAAMLDDARNKGVILALRPEHYNLLKGTV